MELMESMDESGVVTLTLNRPHRRNAFDAALVASLTETLRRLDSDSDARLIILSGAGENFCAGGDIEWMRLAASAPPEENARDAAALAALFEALDKVSKPTIALVQGAAFGGGVGLVACCDIAIAARSAKFCLSEVRLGLIPAVVGPYVVKAIGARRARALFLSAEIIGADCAFHIGLVHEVASDGGLSAVRDRLIEALLLGAPGAQAQAKRLVAACADRPIDASLVRETSRLLAERRASAEGVAGLDGFLNKRPPDWRALGKRAHVP
ncbi:MAG: enoyl-CoA hydratase-related protein [Methylocystis sp.]|uniref:enoyl-CoA hydratase-related protein n=1 Tax=Methylocystis sp. TaxID=1911079 RepID=UPI003DA23D26